MAAINLSGQTDGFFRNYDNGDRTVDNPTWIVSNNGIGQSEAPLGSGLLILGVAGAGYAIAKRRKKQNNSLTLLIAAVMLLGFTQCKKNNVDPTGGETVHITLNIADNGSKVIVDPTGGGGTYATVSFESGDKIYVGNGNKYVGYLTYNGTNSWSGNLTGLDEGDYLHLYFLGNKEPMSSVTAGTTTEFSVCIADQTSKYPVISYNHTTELYKSGKTDYSAVTLYNKCSIMKFNVTTSSTAAICITGMNNKVTVNFATPNGTENGFSFSKDGNGLIKMPKVIENVTWAIVLPQGELAASEADYSIYTNDYQGRRPAIHAIERNHYYNGGISLTFNSTPTGMLLGEFTINSTGGIVHFSKGNLQAEGSNSSKGTTWTWKFADNQYERVGANVANTSINGSMSVSTAGTVDLFGWNGASSSLDNYGINNSQVSTDYGNIAGEYLYHDWGNLAISNGGNKTSSGWRTLTADEWHYLGNTRTNASSKYGHGTVCDIHGVIILPDNFTDPMKNGGSGAFVSNKTQHNWTANVYTDDNWAYMEAAGAVFLPAAGLRSGNKVEYADEGEQHSNEMGYYWTSTSSGDNAANASALYFHGGEYWQAFEISETFTLRYNGKSVRLVR